MPPLPSSAEPSEFLSGARDEDAAQFYVAIDGKPSDRYIKGGHYCLVALIANNITSFYTLGEKITNQLRGKGYKFQKLAKVRGAKRKNIYINAVLDTLIDISKKEKGLRFNYMISSANCEVMNPERILRYYKENDYIREIFQAEVHEKYFIFNHEGQKIKISHNDYGAMIWWNYNLLKIANNLKAFEKNCSWWVHMDRLPLDHDLQRTKLFASMLDWSFKQKLWFSCSTGENLALDILPDFYANLFYDIHSKFRNTDPKILKKIQLLHTLNSKEYWMEKETPNFLSTQTHSPFYKSNLMNK